MDSSVKKETKTQEAAIQVAIRVRPLIRREARENLQAVWTVSGTEVFLRDEFGGRSQASFIFDHIFDTDTSNEDVYRTIEPLVESAVKGIHSTIFAYGQTSSGKTHSISGNATDPGMLPRAINDLFAKIECDKNRKYLIRASYMEIYNEKAYDLLTKNVKDLKIREDYYGNVTVETTEGIVRTKDELMHLVDEGNKNRQVGETSMNERSSRSHVIFKIIIESSEISECADIPVQVSHLYLIDLAGSERVAQTKATGVRLKEGGHINKSLSTLSLVIRQLSENQEFISYRDSKLTRLLSNALGGNSSTLIIANITPASLEDSLSTLMFAKCAKTIKNTPVVNEVLTDAALIKQQKKREIELKSQLEDQRKRNINLEFDKTMKEKKIIELESELQKIRNNFVSVRRLSASRIPFRRHTMAFEKPACLAPIFEITTAPPQNIDDTEMPPLDTEIEVEADGSNRVPAPEPPESPGILYNISPIPNSQYKQLYEHLENSHMELKEFYETELMAAIEVEREKMTTEIETLKRDMREMDIATSSIREERDTAIKQLAEREEVIAEIESLRKELSSRNVAYNKMEKERDTAIRDMNTISIQLAELEISKDLHKTRYNNREKELISQIKDRESLTSKIADLQSQLSSASLNHRIVDEQKATINELQRQLKTVEEESKDLKHLNQQMNEENVVLKNKISFANNMCKEQLLQMLSLKSTSKIKRSSSESSLSNLKEREAPQITLTNSIAECLSRHGSSGDLIDEMRGHIHSLETIICCKTQEDKKQDQFTSVEDINASSPRSHEELLATLLKVSAENKRNDELLKQTDEKYHVLALKYNEIKKSYDAESGKLDLLVIEHNKRLQRLKDDHEEEVNFQLEEAVRLQAELKLEKARFEEIQLDYKRLQGAHEELKLKLHQQEHLVNARELQISEAQKETEQLKIQLRDVEKSRFEEIELDYKKLQESYKELELKLHQQEHLVKARELQISETQEEIQHLKTQLLDKGEEYDLRMSQIRAENHLDVINLKAQISKLVVDLEKVEEIGKTYKNDVEAKKVLECQLEELQITNLIMKETLDEKNNEIHCLGVKLANKIDENKTLMTSHDVLQTRMKDIENSLEQLQNNTIESKEVIRLQSEEKLKTVDELNELQASNLMLQETLDIKTNLILSVESKLATVIGENVSLTTLQEELQVKIKEANSKVEELENDIVKNNEVIMLLQYEIQNLKTSNVALKESLDRMENRSDENNFSKEELQAKIKESDNIITELRETILQNNEMIALQQEELDKLKEVNPNGEGDASTLSLKKALEIKNNEINGFVSKLATVLDENKALINSQNELQAQIKINQNLVEELQNNITNSNELIAQQQGVIQKLQGIESVEELKLSNLNLMESLDMNIKEIPCFESKLATVIDENKSLASSQEELQVKIKQAEVVIEKLQSTIIENNEVIAVQQEELHALRAIKDADNLQPTLHKVNCSQLKLPTIIEETVSSSQEELVTKLNNSEEIIEKLQNTILKNNELITQQNLKQIDFEASNLNLKQTLDKATTEFESKLAAIMSENKSLISTQEKFKAEIEDTNGIIEELRCNLLKNNEVITLQKEEMCRLKQLHLTEDFDEQSQLLRIKKDVMQFCGTDNFKQMLEEMKLDPDIVIKGIQVVMDRGENFDDLSPNSAKIEQEKNRARRHSVEVQRVSHQMEIQRQELDLFQNQIKDLQRENKKKTDKIDELHDMLITAERNTKHIGNKSSENKDIEIKRLKDAIAVLDAKAAMFDALEEEIIVLKDHNNMLRSTLEGERTKLEEITLQLDEKVKEIAKIVELKTALEKDLKTAIEKDNRGLKTSTESPKSEITNLNDEKLKSEVLKMQTLENEIVRLNEELKLVTNLNEMSLLKQENDALKQQQLDIKAELSEKVDEIVSLQIKLDNSNDAINNLKTHDTSSWPNQLQRLEKTNSLLTEELHEKSQEIKKLQLEVKNLSVVTKTSDLVVLRTKCLRLTDELNVAKKETVMVKAELEPKCRQIVSLRAELKQVTSELAEKINTDSLNEENLKVSEESIKQLSSQLEDATAISLQKEHRILELNQTVVDLENTLRLISENLDEATVQLEVSNQTVRDLQTNFKRVSLNLEEATKVVLQRDQTIEQLNQAVLGLQRDLQKIVSSKEDITKVVLQKEEDMKEIANIVELKTLLEKDNSALKISAEISKSEIITLNDELSLLKSEVHKKQTLENEIIRLNEELKLVTNSNEISLLTQENDALKQQQLESQATIEELKERLELAAQCDSCSDIKAELSEKYAEIVSLQKKLDNANEAFNILKTHDASSLPNQLQRLEKTNAILTEQLNEQSQEIKRLQLEVKNLSVVTKTSDLLVLRTKCLRLTDELNAAKKEAAMAKADLDPKCRQIVSLRTELKQVTTELAEKINSNSLNEKNLKVSEKSIKELTLRLEDSTAICLQKERRIVELNQTVVDLESTLKLISEKLEEATVQLEISNQTVRDGQINFKRVSSHLEEAKKVGLEKDQTVRELQTNFNRVSSKLEEATTVGLQKDQTIEEVNQSVLGLQRDLKKIENSKEEIKKVVLQKEQDIQELNQTVVDLKSITDSLKEAISEKDRHIESLTQKIMDLQTNLELVSGGMEHATIFSLQKEAQIEQLKKKVTDIENGRKQIADGLEETEKVVTQKQQKIEQLNKIIIDFQSRIEQISGTLKEAKQVGLQKDGVIAGLNSTIATKSNELVLLQRDLKKTAADNLGNIQCDFKKLTERLHESTSIILEKEKKIEELSSTIQSELNKKLALSKQVETSNKQIEELSKNHQLESTNLRNRVQLLSDQLETNKSNSHIPEMRNLQIENTNNQCNYRTETHRSQTLKEHIAIKDDLITTLTNFNDYKSFMVIIRDLAHIATPHIDEKNTLKSDILTFSSMKMKYLQEKIASLKISIKDKITKAAQQANANTTAMPAIKKSEMYKKISKAVARNDENLKKISAKLSVNVNPAETTSTDFNARLASNYDCIKQLSLDVINKYKLLSDATTLCDRTMQDAIDISRYGTILSLQSGEPVHLDHSERELRNEIISLQERNHALHFELDNLKSGGRIYTQMDHAELIAVRLERDHLKHELKGIKPPKRKSDESLSFKDRRKSAHDFHRRMDVSSVECDTCGLAEADYAREVDKNKELMRRVKFLEQSLSQAQDTISPKTKRRCSCSRKDRSKEQQDITRSRRDSIHDSRRLTNSCTNCLALEVNLKEAEQLLKTLQTELENRKLFETALQKEVDKKNENISDLRNTVSVLSKRNCAKCNQQKDPSTIPHNDLKLQEAMGHIVVLKSELDDKNKQLKTISEQLKTEKSQYEILKEDADSKETEILGCLEEIKSLRSDIEDLYKNAKAQQVKCDIYEDRIQKLQNTKECANCALLQSSLQLAEDQSNGFKLAHKKAVDEMNALRKEYRCHQENLSQQKLCVDKEVVSGVLKVRELRDLFVGRKERRDMCKNCTGLTTCTKGMIEKFDRLQMGNQEKNVEWLQKCVVLISKIRSSKKCSKEDTQTASNLVELFDAELQTYKSTFEMNITSIKKVHDVLNAESTYFSTTLAKLSYPTACKYCPTSKMIIELTFAIMERLKITIAMCELQKFPKQLDSSMEYQTIRTSQLDKNILEMLYKICNLNTKGTSDESDVVDKCLRDKYTAVKALCGLRYKKLMLLADALQKEGYRITNLESDDKDSKVIKEIRAQVRAQPLGTFNEPCDPKLPKDPISVALALSKSKFRQNENLQQDD